MMIKKSLYILCALLLSSAVHIEAMQDDYNNDQLPSQNDKKQTLNKIHNIIDKFQINKAEKEKILHNIS